MIKQIDELREELQKKQKDIIAKGHEIGDFTYGIKNILEWGEGAKLHIGKFCSVADNVTFMLGGNHRTDWISTYPFNKQLKSFKDIPGHPSTKGDTWIGNDVWIGRGATIMSGVCIGDGAVIGAESVVTKDVPPYSIAAGNPARFIRNKFPLEYMSLLNEMKWWDWSDELIHKAIPILMSNDIPRLYKFYKENAYGKQ